MDTVEDDISGSTWYSGRHLTAPERQSHSDRGSDLSKTWIERIDKREEEAAQKQHKHIHLRHLKLRGVQREKNTTRFMM